ncbi:TMV resistance protein N-like [Nymphaea colorata]|uniref:TMV resistance protein N-like n=1 Tax=Nymphaea colorata TaxID=210225 RepID=UPI00129E2013|nr:TMV resistance protein N-like [Nymphaea colorata]
MGASSSSTSFVPSSSLASSSREYEAFLSFREEDIGQGFGGHLYTALRDAGIRTFKDDGEMVAGVNNEKLLKAAQESRCCVVVISSRYANSDRCLNGLAAMFRANTEIIPVFYNVDSYDVRNQSGPFEFAFTKHKQNHTYEAVEEWMHAMATVGKLKGFHVNHQLSRERQVIQDIVERVSGCRDNQLRFVDRPERNFDSPVRDVSELLSLEEGGVKMIGIYGMGAVGKTTVASELLGGLSGRFDEVIIIRGIKDKARNDGLHKLQREFISPALEDNEEETYSSRAGINEIERRFRHKRILAILDDVDDREQLRALAGGRDWFGEGTRIVITARDVQILEAHRVDRKYDAQGLRWINESSSPHHGRYHYQGTDHHFQRQRNYPQQEREEEEGFNTFHASLRPGQDQEEARMRFKRY